MTPKQLREFMRDHDLSAEAIAKLGRVSDSRTVRRWLSGERTIPGPMEQLLRLLSSMSANKAHECIKLLMAAPA